MNCHKWISSYVLSPKSLGAILISNLMLPIRTAPYPASIQPYPSNIQPHTANIPSYPANIPPYLANIPPPPAISQFHPVPALCLSHSVSTQDSVSNIQIVQQKK